LADGRKVLLHIVLGSKENETAWLHLLPDSVKRGLWIPVFVCSDGALDLIKVLVRVFGPCLRQRCLVHKLQNVLSNVPDHLRDEVKSWVRAACYARDEQIARILTQSLEQEYEYQMPSAVACFQYDLDACIAYLHCPAAQHRSIRTINVLGRSFLEEKQRTDTIPGFFTEKSTLKLGSATLLRAKGNRRRVKMSEKQQQQLLTLRQNLDIAYKEQRRKNKRSVV
jgi:putative transposase